MYLESPFATSNYKQNATYVPYSHNDTIGSDSFFNPKGVAAYNPPSNKTGSLYITGQATSGNSTVGKLRVLEYTQANSNFMITSRRDVILPSPTATGVAVDRGQYIYICDQGTVYWLGPAATSATSIYSGTNSHSFCGIAVDTNTPPNVYVAQTSSVLKRTGANPTFQTLQNSPTSPSGIAVDSNGNVYIADAASGTVSAINSTTKTTFGSGYSNPAGLTADLSGERVFVADNGNNQVQMITTAPLYVIESTSA